MPLTKSPIDGSPMRHVNRYGVEIDVCPTSGGIWLDRGELDKIIAIVREEAGGGDPRDIRHHYDLDDLDDDDRPRRRRGPRRSRLTDIFDF